MWKKFFGSMAGKVAGALIVAALGIGGTATVVEATDDDDQEQVQGEDD